MTASRLRTLLARFTPGDESPTAFWLTIASGVIGAALIALVPMWATVTVAAVLVVLLIVVVVRRRERW